MSTTSLTLNPFIGQNNTESSNSSHTSILLKNNNKKIFNLDLLSIQSTIMHVFHRAMQFLSYIFNQELSANTHSQLADYNFKQADNIHHTRFLFGDHLINFSQNTTGIPLEHKRNNSEKQVQLKNIYGDDLEKYFNKISFKSYPVSSNNLYPLSRGVCAGISLEFINKYFSLKSQGKTTSESIEKASSFYTQGATKNAQILQIVNNAVFICKKMKKERNDAMNEFIKKAEKLDKDSVSDEKTWGIALRKLVNVTARTIQALFSCTNEPYKLKLQYNRSFVSLEDNRVVVHSNSNKSVKPVENFDDSFDSLDSGVYSILFTWNKGSNFRRHSIVYVKETNEKGYFFDPNFGCISHTTKEDLLSQYKTLSLKYQPSKKNNLFVSNILKWST